MSSLILSYMYPRPCPNNKTGQILLIETFTPNKLLHILCTLFVDYRNSLLFISTSLFYLYLSHLSLPLYFSPFTYFLLLFFTSAWTASFIICFSLCRSRSMVFLKSSIPFWIFRSKNIKQEIREDSGSEWNVDMALVPR